MNSATPVPERRVFLTGASRGLGLALTEALLTDGWQVVGTARKQSPALESLALRFPGRFQFHGADLGDTQSVERLVGEARLLDGYDAFISNAGIGMDGLVTLLSPDAIQEGVQVNLVTPMLLARAVLKGMLTRGGSLLFIASIAARTGFSGLAAYGATKAGLVGFSRGIAREYGSRNIRSNCILPGFLATDMTASLDAPRQSQLQRRTPLGRLGDPSDVVGSVRFLLSDAARHITGTEVTIDGGMTA
jgi:3-oxoacyl-[acyl-carrier protein] reductase